MNLPYVVQVREMFQPNYARADGEAADGEWIDILRLAMEMTQVPGTFWRLTLPAYMTLAKLFVDNKFQFLK